MYTAAALLTGFLVALLITSAVAMLRDFFSPATRP